MGKTCSEYTNAATCNGAGVVDAAGKCTCYGPETGLGETCSEYNNTVTCNGKGVVDDAGKCTCDGPETGLGETCSEYNNTATCNGVGTVNSVGECKCDGPATGLGQTCSEHSNAKNCGAAYKLDATLGYGTVTDTGTCIDCPESAPSKHPNRNPFDCSCPAGYINAMCDDCAASHQRFDVPMFECRDDGTTKECENGHYFDVGTSNCEQCQPGTYADGFHADDSSDNNLRIACKTCPEVTSGTYSRAVTMTQTSPFASTAVSDCFAKYQAGKFGDAFCMGQGEVDGATKAALIQPEDDPGTPRGTACEAAAAALGFSYRGIIYPQKGCFVDLSTKQAAFYVHNLTDDAKPDFELKPLCVRYTCPSDTDESTFLTEDNNPDDELACKKKLASRVAEANAAVAKESKTNTSTFFPITFGGLMPLVVLIGYIFMLKHQFKTTFRKLPSKVHKWVWAGLWFRVLDVTTDWGFFGISLQNTAFDLACASVGSFDSSTIRTVCLVFCIFGTLLAPFDIRGSFDRVIHDKPAVASWIIPVISVLEDLPQLTLNALYMSILYRYKQNVDAEAAATGVESIEVKPFDAISMISIIGSVSNLCYNLVTMISIRAVKNYKKSMDLIPSGNDEETGLRNGRASTKSSGFCNENTSTESSKVAALEAEIASLRKENKQLKLFAATAHLSTTTNVTNPVFDLEMIDAAANESPANDIAASPSKKKKEKKKKEKSKKDKKEVSAATVGSVNLIDSFSSQHTSATPMQANTVPVKDAAASMNAKFNPSTPADEYLEVQAVSETGIVGAPTTNEGEDAVVSMNVNVDPSSPADEYLEVQAVSETGIVGAPTNNKGDGAAASMIVNVNPSAPADEYLEVQAMSETGVTGAPTTNEGEDAAASMNVNVNPSTHADEHVDVQAVSETVVVGAPTNTKDMFHGFTGDHGGIEL
jgi:hypothetical protein